MRKSTEREEYLGEASVADRLAPYDFSRAPGIAAPDRVEPELVEKAATLLIVMPPNQYRTTIEELLAPHDPARGHDAVEALIAAGYASEDAAGHLRRAG